MALYELIVSPGPNAPAVVREVRKHSTLGISEITRRMESGEPVLTVSTTDHPLEMEIQTGRRRQHAVLLSAHAALSGCGHDVVVRYRPSADYPAEVVQLDQAHNLMESELSDVRQRHD
jgi:hypothetical protein